MIELRYTRGDLPSRPMKTGFPGIGGAPQADPGAAIRCFTCRTPYGTICTPKERKDHSEAVQYK